MRKCTGMYMWFCFCFARIAVALRKELAARHVHSRHYILHKTPHIRCHPQGIKFLLEDTPLSAPVILATSRCNI
ncbi:hypothetical protein EDB19DRAFT_1697592 [Suillus lakei]|nr:hypothetical protein EDB19DRAFT_1697592 [Suillus lakei]